jgi:hypothetical protein
MHRKTHIALIALVAIAALTAGCACAAPAGTAEPAAATMAPRSERERASVPTSEPVAEPVEAPAATLLPTPAAAGGEKGTGGDSLTLPYRPNRLVIKNAELALLVADTDSAIDRTAQIAADTGGYILSSRVWYQEWLGESYKYATITLSVPSDQFESAMRRLRGLAVQVIDETASGQDVTDEYVDLQSRLGNLIATRDRIRSFLDRAMTVEEALQINEELSRRGRDRTGAGPYELSLRPCGLLHHHRSDSARTAQGHAHSDANPHSDSHAYTHAHAYTHTHTVEPRRDR